jgi:hypothetical protein
MSFLTRLAENTNLPTISQLTGCVMAVAGSIRQSKVGCAPHFARCHAAQDLRSIGTSAMFGKKQHVFRLADDPGC